MVMGGTPFYLAKIKKSESVAQNIDRLFFHHAGELRMEYDILFRSLFRESSIYRKVVELLASKSIGLTRDEIMTSLKMPEGGTLTEVLNNLITWNIEASAKNRETNYFNSPTCLPCFI